MYRCKIFENTISEETLNIFLKKLPESANIVSIEYINAPSGSFYNGNGSIYSHPKILIIWTE